MSELGGYIGLGSLAAGLIAFIRIFLQRQIADLREDVTRLEHQMEHLERRYNEERGLKHKARNDLARTLMALELVRRLAKQCTCGVLEPLHEIIDDLFNELEDAQGPPRRPDGT